jgi:hypothetical protein
VNPFQNGDVEAWDEPHDIVGMEEKRNPCPMRLWNICVIFWYVFKMSMLKVFYKMLTFKSYFYLVPN